MAAQVSGGYLEFWKMLEILQWATKLILILQVNKIWINNKSYLSMQGLKLNHVSKRGPWGYNDNGWTLVRLTTHNGISQLEPASI